MFIVKYVIFETTSDLMTAIFPKGVRCRFDQAFNSF